VSVELAPIIIQIANPSAFSGRDSIIVLNLADDDAALEVARKIARETGRGVTLRRADMALIATSPAASNH
jgi:hypothetical protein